MRCIALLALVISHVALAQKTDARLDCQYTGKDFIYDCAISIKRQGQAVAGLDILVGADMPSMPLAHNVKPVKARPTKTPGEYRARLDLEMPGLWAVKLRLAGPVRDQLIVHYNFTETGKPHRK